MRDITSRVEQDGWYVARTSGSHKQYKHDEKKGLVTIAGHPNEDVLPKTLKSICKQAGIELGVDK